MRTTTSNSRAFQPTRILGILAMSTMVVGCGEPPFPSIVAQAPRVGAGGKAEQSPPPEHEPSPAIISVSGTALSPDGLLALTIHSPKGFSDPPLVFDGLRIWDTSNGRLLWATGGPDGGVNGASFLPDGRVVSVGRDGTLKLWDARRGKLLRTMTWPSKVPGVTPAGLAILGDGTRFLAIDSGGHLKVCSSASGQVLLSMDLAGPVYSITSSPDGTRVVAGRQPTLDDMSAVKVLDMVQGREILSLSAKEGWGTAAFAFSPDGKLVATERGCRDPEDMEESRKSGILQDQLVLWEVDSGEVVRKFKKRQIGAWALSFTSDGKQILLAETDALRLWDVATGEEAWSVKIPHGAIHYAFSADRTRVLSANGREVPVRGFRELHLNLWDATNGRLLRALVDGR
jgi:WD40 repeat protein